MKVDERRSKIAVGEGVELESRFEVEDARAAVESEKRSCEEVRSR